MVSGRFAVDLRFDEKYNVNLFLDTVHGGAVCVRTLDLHMVKSLLSECQIDATPIVAGDGKNQWDFIFADVDYELLKRWRLVS